MSSTAEIQSAESQRVTNYIVVATTAFYIYDCLITFDMELQVVWARKATGASVLFIMNRYVCLVVQALEMICQFADISCTIAVWAAQSIVFSGLRVYGVNGRQWKTPLLVVVLGMVPAAANLVYTVNWRMVPDTSTCVITLDTSPRALNQFVLVIVATEICQSAGEALTLGATWYATYQVRKLAHGTDLKPSIAFLLLRDGSLYFGVLFAMCMLEIALNLVAVAVYYAREHTSLMSEPSEVRFAPDLFVGNMGAPLATGGSRDTLASLEFGENETAVDDSEQIMRAADLEDGLEEKAEIVEAPFSFELGVVHPAQNLIRDT
ncbi:predicted protein [Postia placenta Mad-698-R]|nr:predicted protein [Postia placenta Mad-698-R]